MSQIDPIHREPIAIVGIGCRLPGGADSPAKLWELLCANFDAIGPIPPERFDAAQFYDERPATPGKIASRWGGFLDGIERFDADFFGMSPREAERLDPQQRLLLEVAWEAAEDAGIASEQLSGSSAGVFVGIWLNEFESQLFADPNQVDFYMTTGSGRYSASGRISFIFNLLGPSMTVDTACSSSLVAVHLACQSIWSGECELALAGGANVILQPHITIAYSQSGMMAADGRCKFGDAGANGYVRSDGAAIVVLKPLAAALADGNPIYAVIRGSAVTNDGRSSGFLATPGQAGQEEMLRRAYAHAGVDPRAVQYVEAHGTGTTAGDPVELGALGSVLGAGRPADQPCLVGSIKTNIGHTEGAAGVAGLIKAALALKHGRIPASLHLRQPNPNIPWHELRLAVCAEQQPWPAHAHAATAGVSSFGIAGTNAHVVLEAAPEPIAATHDAEQASALLLAISAHTPEALKTLAQSYRALLDDDQVGFANLGYSAGARRTHHRHRIAIAAQDRTEATAALDRFTNGAMHPALCTGQRINETPKIAFVFPGQGAQWRGMARELMRTEPIFRAAIERCELAMTPFVTWSLSEQLLDQAAQFDQIDILQPALFAIQVGLAALWRAWGVEPAAVIGHSMGEVAAAYVAGTLGLEEAARVICVRSRLLRSIRGQGAMAVVSLSLAEAHVAVAGYTNRIAVAVSNSPHSTVISGEPAAREALLEALRARNIFCRMIKVDVASHSPQVDALLPELLSALDGLVPQVGIVPFYSTVSSTVLSGDGARAALGPTYWLDNLRQPVKFATMVENLAADGCNIFIELSPHPILCTSVEETLQHHGLSGYTLPSMQRDRGERVSILGSLGKLYCLGVTPNWRGLYPAGGTLTQLPSYPWQRRRFWLARTTPQREQAANAQSSGTLLGQQLPAVALMPGVRIWDNTLALDALDPALRYPLAGAEILAGGVYAWLGLQAAALALATSRPRLRNLAVRADLLLGKAEQYALQVVLAPENNGTSLRVYGRANDATPWIEHAGGRLDADDDPPPAALDLDAIRARCGSTATDLPGLGDLYFGTNEALAQLQHAEDATGGAINLAASLGLLAALNEAVATGALGRIAQVTYDMQAGAAWAYARMIKQDDDGMLGEAYLLDTAGRIVAAAQGVRLQMPHAELLERIAQVRAGDWLYELAWRQLGPISAHAPHPARMLIFADQSGLGLELARQLAAQGGRALLIYAGRSFERIDDSSYTIDPTSAADMRQLLAEVSGAEHEPWHAAVYLWGLTYSIAAGLSGADLLARQRIITGSALLLGQGLASMAGRGPRLWLVTRCAAPLGTAPIAVEQATLWGFGRVIANEHPERWGGLIDLEAGPPASSAAQLLATLRADDREDQVALRAGERFGARLARVEHAADISPSLCPDVTYLIAGGLGGIGLILARWMLANGARHLALLGRRPIDQAATAMLRSLEQGGTQVIYLQADLTQHEDLGAALAQIAQRMPPLRGVIHAAGLLADAALLRQDWPSFEQALAAKVAGAWNLHTQTITMDLDLFVLCSSVSGIVGTPGQANYAAANTFLDALAHLRRARGLAGISIDWGHWGDIGLAATSARAELLDRRGLAPMPPTVAASAFGRLLAQPNAQITIADIRWTTLLGKMPRGAETPLLREQSPAMMIAVEQPAQDQSDLLLMLEQTMPANRYAALLDHVRERVAAVLRFDGAAHVSPSQGFFQIGMDSLTALELKNQLSWSLGLTLPATLAFDYPTAATLAAHLLSSLFPAEPSQATSQPDSADELAVLDQITRDDLKALLDAELNALDL